MSIQFKKDEIHLAFYEHFCIDPKEEIKKLFAFLGKQFDEKVMVEVKRPSLLTQKQSAILSGDNLVDSWRTNISKEQIQKTVEIVSLFGLHKIYSEDSLPNTENAYKFMDMS